MRRHGSKSVKLRVRLYPKALKASGEGVTRPDLCFRGTSPTTLWDSPWREMEEYTTGGSMARQEVLAPTRRTAVAHVSVLMADTQKEQHDS